MLQESSKVEITQLHTACRGCAFAQFDGNSQVGCLTGALDKFRAQGSVVEAYDENGTEFYIINRRNCRWFREISSSLEDIRIENEIKYGAIVWWENGFEDLIYTIKSLMKQFPRPKRITVVNPRGLEPQYVDRQIRPYLDNIPLNILFPVETEGRENCLELAYRDCKLPIFMSFDAGFEVPEDFASTIDNAVNDKLINFSMVVPDKDGNGLVGLSLLYSLMGSTEDFRFIDRVIGFTKEANEEYLVKNFEELR